NKASASFNGFCSSLGRHVSRLLKTPSLRLFGCLRSPLICQIFSILLTSVELETVRVSPQPVEMVDTQHAVDAELGTVLVSHQSVEMLDTQHAVDDNLGTVLVSQQLVEMPNIQHAVDAELGTALVSRQLCELPHALPVQAFAVRLVERSR
ncbi:hypothetical protein JTB14_000772, partial [Gonioctena quinquepunctata]